MYESLSILEPKFSMYVLLAIKDHPGICKTDLLKLEDGNERTKFVRINDLIKAGLIETRPGETQWNTIRLYLSPVGQEVATSLENTEKALSNLLKPITE